MKFIAELCQNHNGDMNILREMVKQAAESGADIVKIQNIYARHLINWKEFEEFRPYEAEYERLKGLELSFEDEIKFVEYCKEFNVEPMTTLFSLEQNTIAKSFDKVGYKNLKISGYSMDNLVGRIIKSIANGLQFEHLYFSTSSMSLDDIEKSIDILNENKIKFTMLNCTCIYPTPLEKLNLQNIPFYKEHFSLDRIGLSDHSNPHEDNLLSSKLAIFQGIDALERHFTILDKDETRDGKVSITPDMLKELKRFSQLEPYLQYIELNKFNDIQKFNHQYYKSRF